MSKLIKIVLCLMFVTSVVNAQQKTYKVSGVVLDSATNKPLQGVYVTNGNDGNQTNSKGEYILENLKFGKAVLQTMYFEDYFISTKILNLTKDTVVNFKVRQKILKMDEIVVTGTRTEKRLSETPVLTTVISSRELVSSGATSVSEALQDNIPGMIISDGAMGTSVNIRGLNTRYVVFMVDGERLIAEGAGGSVNLDQVDVDNISKIEVVNGAASALYGSNAVGAVINIITKKPVHKFQAGTNVSYENHNTLRARANVGFKHNKFSGTISGLRSSSDGFGSVEESGAMAAKYVDYGANLKLGYNPTERIDLNVTGKFFSHETFSFPGTVDVYHPKKYTFGGGFNGGYKSKDDRNNLRMSVNFDNFVDYKILEQLDNEKKKENEIYYLSARAVNNFKPIERLEIVGGIEFNQESNFSKTTLGKDPITKLIEDYNIFAQADYELLKDFDIVAGARYTYNSQFSSAFSPKVSLMYSIKGLSLRAGVGTAFRAPTIKELYYNFDHQGMFWIFGNPDLKAENGLYSSFTAEYNKGTFNVSATPYYNEINDKITQYTVIKELESGNEVKELHYKNISSATLMGIDISASYTFFNQLELSANYSFCDAVDNSTALQLPNNVKHSGTVGLTWRYRIAGSPFSVQFDGRITSPRLYSSSDSDGNVVTETSKGYNIWKAVLVKPFRINKHTLELTFKVDNIFGFSDATYLNTGTMYMIGIRYAFK